MSNKWNRADVLTLTGLVVSVMSLIVAIITFATPEVRRCIGLESGGCLFSKRKTSPDSTLNSSEKTNTTSLPQTPKQSPSGLDLNNPQTLEAIQESTNNALKLINAEQKRIQDAQVIQINQRRYHDFDTQAKKNE
ncbi:hypothetical protein H6G64_10705 [Calothrix sp. FACHB-156]|nr:hypothetical protein [Calothrix sp. FACHB-156]